MGCSLKALIENMQCMLKVSCSSVLSSCLHITFYTFTFDAESLSLFFHLHLMAVDVTSAPHPSIASRKLVRDHRTQDSSEESAEFLRTANQCSHANLTLDPIMCANVHLLALEW